MRNLNRRSRQSGMVFVVTLAILTVIVAVVASVAATQQVAIKQEANRMEQRQARLMAEAGIWQAVETMSDAASSGGVTNTSSSLPSGSAVNLPSATTLQDDWAAIGTGGNDRFILKNGSFRLQILDASSRINVSTATTAWMNNLPLDQEHIDALLDWRSAGETARSDGAKDDYYNALPKPYDAALQPLSTPSEILDVRYFTPADVYDPPTTQNTNAPQVNFPDGRTPTVSELVTTDSTALQLTQTGTPKTNLNGNVATVRTALNRLLGTPVTTRLMNMRGSGFTGWAQIIGADPGMSTTTLRTLLNTYTIGSATQPGKINLNTASQAVLQTIPNVTSDIAQSIVNQQTTGFTTLGAILTIPGLGTVNSVRNIVDDFTVKSSTFIVRVIGTSGYTHVALEAIVTMSAPTATSSGTATIVRMEEQPFNDMTGRWGWQATTTNDITLEVGA